MMSYPRLGPCVCICTYIYIYMHIHTPYGYMEHLRRQGRAPQRLRFRTSLCTAVWMIPLQVVATAGAWACFGASAVFSDSWYPICALLCFSGSGFLLKIARNENGALLLLGHLGFYQLHTLPALPGAFLRSPLALLAFLPEKPEWFRRPREAQPRIWEPCNFGGGGARFFATCAVLEAVFCWIFALGLKLGVSSMMMRL